MKLGFFYLVYFSEDDTERHLQFSEMIDKFKVDLLRFDAAVDQDEHTDEVFSVCDIIVEHHFPCFAIFLRTLCETITRQIDEIPFFVDEEMVYRYRLSRSR